MTLVWTASGECWSCSFVHRWMEEPAFMRAAARNTQDLRSKWCFILHERVQSGIKMWSTQQTPGHSADFKTFSVNYMKLELKWVENDFNELLWEVKEAAKRILLNPRWFVPFFSLTWAQTSRIQNIVLMTHKESELKHPRRKLLLFPLEHLHLVITVIQRFSLPVRS